MLCPKPLRLWTHHASTARASFISVVQVNLASQPRSRLDLDGRMALAIRRDLDEVDHSLRLTRELDDLNLTTEEKQPRRDFYENHAEKVWRSDLNHPNEDLVQFEGVEYITETRILYNADKNHIEDEEIRVSEKAEAEHLGLKLIGRLRYPEVMDSELEETLLNDDERGAWSTLYERENPDFVYDGKTQKTAIPKKVKLNDNTEIMNKTECQDRHNEEKTDEPPVTVDKAVQTALTQDDLNRKELDKNSEQLRSALAQVTKMSEEMTKLLNTNRDFANSAQRFNTYMKRLSESAEQIVKQIKSFASMVVSATDEVKTTAAQLRSNVQNEVENMSQEVRSQSFKMIRLMQALKVKFHSNENWKNDETYPDNVLSSVEKGDNKGADNCADSRQKESEGQNFTDSNQHKKRPITTTSRAKPRCYNCDGHGHKSYHCPRIDGKKMCFACHQFMSKEHIDAGCPMKLLRPNRSRRNQRNQPIIAYTGNQLTCDLPPVQFTDIGIVKIYNGEESWD